MNATTENLQVGAFVDGELELAARLEMERRLREDDSLRRRVEEAAQLRKSVRESAEYHAAPAEFRQRMTALLAPQPRPGPAGGPSSAAVPARWFGWRSLAASMGIAAVLALGINLAWLASSKEEQLTDAVVASHVRSTLGQHLVDVASSDRHTVKPFLSSRLDFSPPVDELGLPGSAFLGGRVDYLDGRPVAALVYRQGEHVVNAFVWPATSRDSAPRFSEQRGYRMAHWSRDGMTHWVVSDVNREEFQAIVRALESVGSHR